MGSIKVSLNGELWELEATRRGDRIHVTLGDKSEVLRLLYTNGSSYVLERELPDGTRQRIRAVGHVDGDHRQIWVNGRAFTYERVRPQSQNQKSDYSQALSATIPALVSEVLVEVGDDVSMGDKLILLESMKMIIPIQSPCDGQVRKINCAVGDAVKPGVQLVEIEADSSRGKT